MRVKYPWFVMVWILASVESSGIDFKGIGIDQDLESWNCKLFLYPTISFSDKYEHLPIDKKFTNLPHALFKPKSIRVVGPCSWKICTIDCNCILANDSVSFFHQTFSQIKAKRIKWVVRVEKDQTNVKFCSKKAKPRTNSNSSGANYLPQISTLDNVDSTDYAETSISNRMDQVEESSVSGHQDVNALQSESDMKDLEDERVNVAEGTNNPLMGFVTSSPLPNPLDISQTRQVDEDLGQSTTIFDLEKYQKEIFPVMEQRALPKPTEEPIGTNGVPWTEFVLHDVYYGSNIGFMENFDAETNATIPDQGEAFPPKDINESTESPTATSATPWTEPTTIQDVDENAEVDFGEKYLTDIPESQKVETTTIFDHEDYTPEVFAVTEQQALSKPTETLVSTSKIPEALSTHSTITEAVQTQKTPKDVTDNNEIPDLIDSETTTAFSDLENYKMELFPPLGPTALPKSTKEPLSTTEIPKFSMVDPTIQYLTTSNEEPQLIDSETSSTWSLWSDQNQIEISMTTTKKRTLSTTVKATQSKIKAEVTATLSSIGQSSNEIEMTESLDIVDHLNVPLSPKQTLSAMGGNLKDWQVETDLPQSSRAHQSSVKTSSDSSDTTTLIPISADLNEMHANEMALPSYTPTSTTTPNPFLRHPIRQEDEIRVEDVHANQDRASLSDLGFSQNQKETEPTFPCRHKFWVDLLKTASSYFWTVCALVLFCAIFSVSFIFWAICKPRMVQDSCYDDSVVRNHNIEDVRLTLLHEDQIKVQ